MPCVVRRWHGVWLKYLKWISERKLLTVHGAAALLRLMSIRPRLVVRWAVKACLVSTPVSGGRSTLRAAGGVLTSLYLQLPGLSVGVVDAEAVGEASVIALVPSPILVASRMAPIAIRATPSTLRMIRLRCRRRAAAAARRAACRSARIRASSFSRLLLATGVLLLLIGPAHWSCSLVLLIGPAHW